jgi:hypothetical protein
MAASIPEISAEHSWGIRSHLGLLLAWLATAAILYGPLIKADTLLNRDDLDLVNPLREIHGLREYFAAVFDGRVFDLNPLRDLSYKLNLAFEGIPLLGNFHFGNCVIWFGCCATFFLILNRLKRPPAVICGVLLLFACHPAMVNSVCWVAARKHLLALLFIEAATLLALSPRYSRRRYAGIFGCYLAALLCQPIVILWPAWWVLYLRYERGESWRRALTAVTPLFVPLVAAAAANDWYYSGPYLRATGGYAKFASRGLALDLGFSLRMFGRQFFQIIFPFRVSTLDYNADSFLNLLGLAILSIALLAAWNLLPRSRVVTWLSPFVLALAVVAVRPTNVFVSDSYSLWPAFGIAVLLAEMAGCARSARIFATGALVIASFFFARSVPLARAWLSTESAIAYAYDVEPSSQVNYYRTLSLVRMGQWEEAMKTATLGLNNPTLGRAAFAQVVLLHPGIPMEKKEEWLRRYPAPTISYSARLAVVLAKEKKFGEAYTLLRPFAPLLGSVDSNILAGFDDHAVIAADLLLYCRKAATPVDCQVIERHLRAQLSIAGKGAAARFDVRLAE